MIAAVEGFAVAGGLAGCLVGPAIVLGAIVAGLGRLALVVVGVERLRALAIAFLVAAAAPAATAPSIGRTRDLEQDSADWLKLACFRVDRHWMAVPIDWVACSAPS